MDFLVHFDFWNVKAFFQIRDDDFENFLRVPPMNYQDFGLKIKFLNIKNLISNIKMDQNSGLKAPKKLACLLVKKYCNNGLELGNIKLIILYKLSTKCNIKDLYLATPIVHEMFVYYIHRA